MELAYELPNIKQAAQKIIENSHSKILLFYGEMGAGKTTLIKAIVKQLGLKDNVASPTFGLVNEYGNENKVYHFDFYRVKNQQEAYDMGFEEYLAANAWVCIEWPEKIETLLPQNHTAIYIKQTGNTSRRITIHNA